MEPTDEQKKAIELFQTGESLVIEAGAGTGKTSTLEMMADVSGGIGQYTAFNKAICDDASKRFPPSVKCNTAHSLAFRSVGHKYKGRLGAPRMRSEDIASLLGIYPFRVETGEGRSKRLAAGFLASWVMRGIENFCQSADEFPSAKHFPKIDGIDFPDVSGKRTFRNNALVRNEFEGKLLEAWKDLCKTDNGNFPFRHSHYLKMFERSGPFVDAEFILFDEAQDASPVMRSIVEQQDHAQLVYVGDSQQAIYGWTGAVNALANVGVKNRAFLTQSFRFGQPVADLANSILDMLDAELRLSGSPDVESKVAPLSAPDVHLTRTNALAVQTVILELAAHRRPHIVGGASDVISFTKSAWALMSGKPAYHPDLACFDNWGEVLEYVEGDQLGDELKLLVSLINQFGCSQILDALENTVTERQADVIVSTAHKAKGREWSTVKLSHDFPAIVVTEDGVDPSDMEELRLLYVACTRARHVVDPYNTWLFGSQKM